MDFKKTERFLRDFGLLALMVMAGLILTLNPDGAEVLITRLLGLVLVIPSTTKLVIPAIRKKPVLPREWLVNGVLIAFGVVMLAKPLLLADAICHVFCAGVVLWGIEQLPLGKFHLGTAMYILCALVLISMPRPLTPRFLVLVGIVLLIISVIKILAKARRRKMKG